MEDTLATGLIFVFFASMVFLLGRKRFAVPAADPIATPVLIASPVFGPWTEALANAIPMRASQRKQLSKDMVASGIRSTVAVDDFLAKRNLAIFLTGVTVASVLATGLVADWEFHVVIAGSIGCCCLFSIPKLVLSGKAARRRQQIEKAIPDAIDMIAMSIEGGLPIAPAVQQTETQLRNLYPELAEELRIVTWQSDSGSLATAFDRLADRIDLPEVIAWCAMMRQSDKLGGKLVESLGDYATRIRQDRLSRAERSGNTASLKLLLPVVLCLAPPIGILLIGPAAIEFRDFIQRNKDQTQTAIERVQEAN